MFVYQMWPQMKLNYRNIIIIIIICSYFKQVLLTTAVKVVDSVHWYVINIYEIWDVLNVFSTSVSITNTSHDFIFAIVKRKSEKKIKNI